MSYSEVFDRNLTAYQLTLREVAAVHMYTWLSAHFDDFYRQA